jgi:DNA-directed RNA polymerase subunit omega
MVKRLGSWGLDVERLAWAHSFCPCSSAGFSIELFGSRRNAMARITVEDCMKRINNRFLLVHLAAKRVTQLRKGAKPLVDAPKNREIVLALREIAGGLVTYDALPQLEPDQLPAEVGQTDGEKVDVESVPEEASGSSDLEADIEALAEETSTRGAEEDDVID